MEHLASPKSDFQLLDSRDTYALYFNHLSAVFARMIAWYGAQAGSGHYESSIVSHFLERLLCSVRALRLKYTHHPSQSLKVDLTESGFPSSLEVMELATDLLRREQVLRDLPSATATKREMLDYMLNEKRQPVELLWQMSQRAFMELLGEDELLLTFSEGWLKRLEATSAGDRSYVFSWACYDFATNRPYIHVMSFEQDYDRPPLEEGGANYHRFIDMVKGEGSRAPSVGVLAAAIDQGLVSIHPKILKRLCIGPMYSRFLGAMSGESRDPLRTALIDLLAKYGRNDDDCVLFFDEEVIFSKRQEVSRSIFSPGGTVREVFHIPESDPDCYKRRASVIHRNVLMPHFILQHAQGEDAISALDDCTRIAYTEKGEFHGI